MTRDTMDVADWAEVRYSESEIPLVQIISSIREDSKSYTLKRSKQYPSSWMLWDVLRDEVVVATHAFVIRFCSPLETGNFVPERESAPEGLVEYMKKTEPSGLAQISLTFDTRMDDTLQPNLAALEAWAERVEGFDTRRRKRNPWMSPTYVLNQSKYTVTSQLFQTKTAFNSKANTYSVPYEVHPWIREACIPHNPSWVPNPGRIQFFDGQDGTLDDLAKSNDPTLRAGDLVKLTFKIIFTVGREMWNMQFSPIQAIRVGQIDTTAGAQHVEDHNPINLPKVGDRLMPIPNSKKRKTPTRGPSRSTSISPRRKRGGKRPRTDGSDSEPLTDWTISDGEGTAKLTETQDVDDMYCDEQESGKGVTVEVLKGASETEEEGTKTPSGKKEKAEGGEDDAEQQKKRRTGRRGAKAH